MTTLIELIRAFASCVRAGGHQFENDVCVRCGAKKGGRTIGSIIRDVQDERAARREVPGGGAGSKGKPS